MDKPKVVVDLTMVKKSLMDNGFSKTLSYVSQAGIGYVNIPSSLCRIVSEKTMRTDLEALQVRALALLVDYNSDKNNMDYMGITGDLEKILQIGQRIGCSYICIRRMPPEFINGPDEIRDVCSAIRKYAVTVRQYGMKLCWQCGNEEFEKIEGTRILDYLLELIPGEDMDIVLNSFWVHMGGENVFSWIEKCSGRNSMFVVQDVKIQIPQGRHLVRSLLLDDSIRLTEAGYGNLPIAEMIHKAIACGSEYFILDQEDTYEKTPFESIGISVQSLKTVVEMRH